MNEYMSAIIVAIITGVFSVIAIIIQRKQDKVIKDIDEKSKILAQDKQLKQQIHAEEKKLELITYEMVRLMIEGTVALLAHTITDPNPEIRDQYIKRADELGESYNKIKARLDDLNTQNDLMKKLTNDKM